MRYAALIVLLWGVVSALTPSSFEAAGAVTLAWDPNSGTNVIAGYKIYYGGSSRAYTNVTSVSAANTLTISNLLRGKTYYFAATAIDAFGLESDYSTEASALIPTGATNQPPTLDLLVNVAINENAGLQIVSLSGITSGATNEVQTLAVTAASSNPSLIPTPTVNYTSPNTTGSLAFAPVAAASGSATITVTVNDGGDTNNLVARSFLVTVIHTEPRPACTYALSLSQTNFNADSSDGTFTITADSNCVWSIEAPAWVSFSSTNGSGDFSGTFTVEANTNELRTGLVSVIGGEAEVSCTLTQEAVVAETVVLTTPQDGAILEDRRPQFSWSESTPAATKYYLWISRNGTNYLNKWIVGATNWVAPTALPAGTYTWWVQSWSPAGYGPRSATSIVDVVSVPSDRLRVRTNGRGAFSPNYCNAVLEIGRKYSLKATGISGYAFTNWVISTNWVGALTTNGPTVQFLMQSNLTLQANFVDVARPTNTVTAPKSGQRWSNAVFTVTGTARDNAGVTGVWYQLNTNDWALASSGNGWTNWTADVTLTPGANTVRVYVADTAGNRSLTNSVKFVYVLSDRLLVRMTGRGTLSPNLSNAMLEIGKLYSLRATGTSGYAFTNWVISTNWVGNLTTNGPTVQFLMQSNLTLQANFVDVARPTNTVTAPKSGQRWSNAVFTVTGTARDNAGVTGVWYQLNTNDWVPASSGNGWTNWTANVTLTPGANTVRAYAADAAGNRSVTNSVRFVYVLSDRLLVRMTGRGTLSPNYSNAMLEIGKLYSLKATGTGGYAFTNWVISTNWVGALTTNGPTVQFLMQSNLTLQANFVDVARPTNTVTAPKSGQRWSNAVFTVTGTARDNAGVTGVWYQLNTNDWASASSGNGWTNWTADVTLMPGANTLRAFAVDAVGNRSVTNSVIVNYVQSGTNTLKTLAAKAVGNRSVSDSADLTSETGLASTPEIPLQFLCGKRDLAVTNKCLQMRLSGPAGATVVVESSPDLVHWQPVHTNTVPAEGLPLSVPMNLEPARFFRTRLLP